MPGATRSIFCCNSQYRTISANVQCAIASVYNARWYQTCFCNSLCRTMSARLKCTIATACNAGCYQIISTYYLDTINASSPFLPSDRESGKNWMQRKSSFYNRENLISLLYYGHQLKGEDMKCGMLLGVALPVQRWSQWYCVEKDKMMQKLFHPQFNLPHTHTQRQSWHHQCISRQQQRRDAFSDHDQTHPIGWSRVQCKTFFYSKSD